MLLYGYTGSIFFTLLPKPIFPYEMSFYQIQSKLQYGNIRIAIHSNTIHNTALTCIVLPLMATEYYLVHCCQLNSILYLVTSTSDLQPSTAIVNQLPCH